MTAERLPLITVATVSYNERDNIEATILSVLEQTYPYIEYLFVDGGSTDGTAEAIAAYARRYPERIAGHSSEPDRGIYDAMNKAARRAGGEFLLYMNAGDCFAHPEALEALVMGADLQADLIYGNHEVVYPSFRKQKKARPISLLWQDMCFSHQSLLTRTELLRAHPFQYERFRISADYHQIYSFYQQGRAFCHVPVKVARFSAGGVSEARVVESYREVMRIVSEYEHTPEMLQYHEERIRKQQRIQKLRERLPERAFLLLMRLKNVLLG